MDWAIVPGCGAVVTFAGTVRDHAEGRSEVVSLDYEAYVEGALARLDEIAGQARLAHPDLGRLALLHRTGRCRLTEISVLVGASTPHRDAAFEVARWCIDTVKETVPIWKKETWSAGTDWGTGAQSVRPVEARGSR